MAGDWSTVIVADIAATTRNAIVGGPFGSNLVSKDYVDSGIPVIRGQNMGQRWVSGEFAFVTDEKAKALEANIARPGDIVFTQRGTLGQVSLVPVEPYERYVVSQSQMKLTGNPELADATFLYYVFSSSEQQDYIRQHAIQTGVPHTNLGILRDTPVQLPPLAEQRAIAHILGTLDDKIELNRRMNETLEAMARAIFKSWFVDFDPVRAKTQGEAPESICRRLRLTPDLLALFPDRLVDAAQGSANVAGGRTPGATFELCEIPEGWAAMPLPEVFEINPARTLRKGEMAPYLDMANMPTAAARAISHSRRAFGSGMKFQNGDTLVARITPCLENGKTCFVDFLGENEIGWGSTEYIVFRPKLPFPNEFAYFLARTDAFRKHAIANMTGTSGRQRVPASAFDGFRVVVPSNDVAFHFGGFANAVIAKMRANDDESRTLSLIRDILLPKLLSGDLRIANAETFLENAP
jgi:type I restriction enzyme S subunit